MRDPRIIAQSSEPRFAQQNPTVVRIRTLRLTYTCTCIDKSMQIVLERGSLDKPLTFNIGLLQLVFHTSVFI